MTLFHILRHGEHALQGRVVAGRMPGIGLSERGRAEAGSAAERLVEAGIAAIYASPLQRARETAGIVASRLAREVAIRDDLNELDFGEWTGSTFDEVRKSPHWPAWSNHRSLATIPGGETMRAVQRRIVETLVEFEKAHGDDSVLLVSHGDVIRAGLAFALGMPIEYLTRIEVATGSLSTVRIDANGIRVVKINDRARI